MSKIREFEQTPPLPPRSRMRMHLEQVLLSADLLEEEDFAALRSALPSRALARNGGYDDNLDLKAEVAEQIRLLKALRQSVFGLNGQPQSGASVRDAKDVLTTAQGLLGLLVRLQEKIDRDDRLRRIELACIAAIRGLPHEAQAKFFSQLEDLLEAA